MQSSGGNLPIVARKGAHREVGAAIAVSLKKGSDLNRVVHAPVEWSRGAFSLMKNTITITVAMHKAVIIQIVALRLPVISFRDRIL